MKRFFALVLCAAFVLSGCGKSGVLSETVLEEKNEGDIVSEGEDDGTAFDYFFACYANSELADSVTKDKQVDITMYEETDHPYVINSKTHLQKVKVGDEYEASFILDDHVADNSSFMEGCFYDGLLYYSVEDGLYKQAYDWSDVKYIIDGNYFSLYEYTVSGIHITNYDDGSLKLTFSFDLQNLSEAPDEEIFEILQSTGTTYKNLSFNDASLEGYINADGYVTGYKMFYDGQVFSASDVFTFKYTTTASYTDINSTKVEIPENPDDYDLLEIIDEDETSYN